MPSQRQRIYLAYGSNLHPSRLEARVGPAQLLGVVRLPGWSLRFDKRGGDGSAKANILAAPGSDLAVHAAAFSLRSDQVSKLDVYEGCGSGYETIPIDVDLRGERVNAFTYLAPSQWTSNTILPFDWYVDLIVSGAKRHGFDEFYIQQLERQPVCKDPDSRRAIRELRAMKLPLRTQYQA